MPLEQNYDYHRALYFLSTSPVIQFVCKQNFENPYSSMFVAKEIKRKLRRIFLWTPCIFLVIILDGGDNSLS